MRPREQRSPAARSDHHGHYFLTRAEREGVRSGHGGTLERCWMEAKTAARVPPRAPARCRRHSPARDVAAIPIGRSIRRPWISAVASAIAVVPAMAVALTRVPPALRLVPVLGRGLCHVRVPVLPGCRSYYLPQPGPLPSCPRQQLKLRDSEALFSPYALQVLARPHKFLAGSSKTDEPSLS